MYTIIWYKYASKYLSVRQTPFGRSILIESRHTTWTNCISPSRRQPIQCTGGSRDIRLFEQNSKKIVVISSLKMHVTWGMLVYVLMLFGAFWWNENLIRVGACIGATQSMVLKHSGGRSVDRTCHLFCFLSFAFFVFAFLLFVVLNKTFGPHPISPPL